MVLEVFGFISGVGGIGLAWVMLLRHERFKVINSFYTGRHGRAPSGNALIWPSR